MPRPTSVVGSDYRSRPWFAGAGEWHGPAIYTRRGQPLGHRVAGAVFLSFNIADKKLELMNSIIGREVSFHE
ncbi:hypothetical protein NKJ48_32685 [Mesorhizobium sp. M0114]|uniref:hypothetical protein n=1 Tax=unclassified Mesorhizobium TaxID=325217 RepID=UPI003335488B